MELWWGRINTFLSFFHPLLHPFPRHSSPRAVVSLLRALNHSQESENPSVRDLFLSRERQQKLLCSLVLILSAQYDPIQ